MLHILHIDDCLLQRKVLKGQLAAYDINLFQASKPEEAINTLKTSEVKFDLIILDIEMPSMNGFQVCEIIKADNRLKEIPIILCSSNNQRDDIINARKVGAIDYIVKPYQTETIITKIMKATGVTSFDQRKNTYLPNVPRSPSIKKNNK